MKTTERSSPAVENTAFDNLNIPNVEVQLIDDDIQDPNHIVVVDYEDYPAEWSGHFAVCFDAAEGQGFAGLPPFMPLLNLFPEEFAEKSLCLVKGIVDSAPEPDTEIVSLFEQINWQFHLPAAVATLMSVRQMTLIQSLWNAFDHGSWVMPQLAVIASLADGEFSANAKHRITNLCPVDSPDGLSSFENHLLRGPANDVQRSAKGVNSLLALCATQPDLEDWCKEISASGPVADLSKQDIDSSAHIAISWLDRLTAKFATFGLTMN